MSGPEEFSPYDAADYLTDEAAIAAYIEAAQEEAGDDPEFVAWVHDTVARARGRIATKDGGRMTKGHEH